MPIIIDGYNLLRAIQMANEDPESINDVQLCRLLSSYFKLIGEEGEIIFDGTGPRDKQKFEDMGNLEVIFAGPGSDADTIIEDKISASTAPKRLTVVSSDRRLRRAARTRRATAVKSLDFWDDVHKQLSRKRPPKEPPGKRQGISEGETDQWLKLFKLDK